jgi:hypothetical protein
MARYAALWVIAALLLFVGCREQSSDSRLIDVGVKQDEHKGDIDRLSRRIEGFDKRLARIQESLKQLPEPTGSPEPATTAAQESTEPKVVEFKDTPEYAQIVAQLSAVQQQLALTQSRLTESQDEVAAEEQRRQLQDPAQAFQAMNDPQEMNRRLSLLGQNFAGKIQDPVKRQQFEVDIEQLKRKLSETPSTQELYQRVTASLTERLNTEQNDRAKEFIQRQIQELQTASGEDLQGRLDRYQRFETFRELRDLQSNYDIPRETLTEAGLPSMGGDRGGPGGPGGQGGFNRGNRGGQQGRRGG